MFFCDFNVNIEMYDEIGCMCVRVMIEEEEERLEVQELGRGKRAVTQPKRLVEDPEFGGGRKR